MPPVIQVESLSKRYRLGQIGGGTLREDANRWWARVRGRPDPTTKVGAGEIERTEPGELWALRDISFDVTEGEILGIIGRNGAGKSTLLKILSRITAPTRGRAVLRGRVGSLLEVGTGFHPELTGRENIYLNGTILGMTKAEVDLKFDEIVEFSEMAQFVDTPVKRYSSGMTVRLAFAVAAHLEPELLIVDEVLAVGDAQFQEKCLGKLESVASLGRTILFVSHNMQAVRSLCSRCVLLAGGELAAVGPPDATIRRYLTAVERDRTSSWRGDEGLGTTDVRLHEIAVTSPGADAGQNSFLSSLDLHLEMELWLARPLSDLCVGFELLGGQGEPVLASYDTDAASEQFAPLRAGWNRLRCTLPAGLLNAGRYQVAPRLALHNRRWLLNCDPLISFQVVLAHGISPYWNSLGTGGRAGVVAPIFRWQHDEPTTARGATTP